MPSATNTFPPTLAANSGSAWNPCAPQTLRPAGAAALHHPEGEEMVGDSPQIRAIHQCIDRVSITDATVLITGETGTGKELLARKLHRLSKRQNGPFVAINCAAIPETLVESELFGFEKGSFTGANSPQEGRLLQSNGGTLFLDEIADLSPLAQAKLLRVLEQREVQPLGSRKARTLDARVVAATNQRLEQIARVDTFRRDLFFRLNVVSIYIPPLRERQEDIPLIAAHFLEKLSAEYGRPQMGLTPPASDYLKERPWNGNARELRNVIERAVLFCRSDYITLSDITRICGSSAVWTPTGHVSMSVPSGKHNARSTSRICIPARKVSSSPESELTQLRNALEQTQWNKTKTAELLRWSRMTIYRKIIQYDLRPSPAGSSLSVPAGRP